jgi:CRISPR-associated protein Csm1
MEIALAALVHDVGKLAQRANRCGERIGAEAQRLQDMVCPTGPNGKPTHLHALYTADFILTHLRGAVPDGIDPERVLRLAAYHHRPDEFPGSMRLAEADRLSAGMEREASGSTRENFREVRLQAIVDAVGGNPVDDRSWVHRLEPLSPAAAYPENQGQPRDRTEEYRDLWQGFLQSWSRMKLRDPRQYVNRALSVLERYTWCVPSATNARPDTSLYDHTKTTMAIACALHLRDQAAEGDGPEFLLVSGEFGGIQDFIYDVKLGQGGLARRLRARSFYVWLASESTAHQILWSLGLPLANCVLSAGGRFTLLLPNTENTRQQVRDAYSALSQWCCTAGEALLRPVIASIPISRADLCTDFGTCLEKLASVQERARLQPLGGVLSKGDGWDECAFVQRMPLPTQGGEPDDPLGAGRLGSRLARARYVRLDFGQKLRWKLPFGSFDLSEQEPDPTDCCYLVLDLEGGCGEREESPVVGRFVARHIPVGDTGEALEFTELAARGAGRAALGYLKADVDNLGLIFTRGLRTSNTDRRSISRLATLSRALEVFFSGRVQDLASKHDAYIVYSGGDDLLAVGPWDAMVRFGLSLREEFRQFTAGNSAWTLSAGLALATGHTPSLVAADQAEHALEASKRSPGTEPLPYPPRRGDTAVDPSKDRVTMLGCTMPWIEAAEAVTQAQALEVWLRGRQLSSGQVRRLLTCAELYQEWQRTGDVLCCRYAPMLVYDIRRNWTGAPSEACEWAKSLTLQGSKGMPTLRCVCDYALYAARGDDDSEG